MFVEDLLTKFVEEYLIKIESLKEKGLIPQLFSGPVMVSWDITRRCNFNCIFCFNNSTKIGRDTLSGDEMVKITKQICKVRPFWVCFCGGEPLLKEEIFNIAKILTKCNIQVSMVTNGWFINKEISKRLKNSGIRAIQVSLDGCKPETHDFLRQKKGSFVRALKPIENCVKEGIHVDIAFCPTKLNYKEIVEVVDFAVKMGVKSLRSQPLMILGRALLNMHSLVLTPVEERDFIMNIKKAQEEYINKFEIYYGNPLVHFLTFPHIPCSFLHITSEGAIKISPYIPFTFGNLLTNEIEDLWKERLVNIWRNKLVLKYINDIKSVRDFEKKKIVVGIDEDVEIKGV